MQTSRLPRLALVVMVAVLLAVVGCSVDTNQAREGAGADNAEKPAAAKAQPAEREIGELSVAELASGLDTKSCTAVDANGATTRGEHGVIPGAVLLTHYRNYDPGELPAAKDSKLVFYCSNQQCGASHAAAEKALLAGYTDVHVLPAGVMGWKQSGQPTQTVQ